MSSTALSVSVTRSDAAFLGWDQRGSSTSSGSRRKGLVPVTSFNVKIRGLGNVQFFFVSTVDGLADTIIRPAFLATSRRVSWISFRFGSPILLYATTEGGMEAEKGIVDFPRTIRILRLKIKQSPTVIDKKREMTLKWFSIWCALKEYNITRLSFRDVRLSSRGRGSGQTEQHESFHYSPLLPLPICDHLPPFCSCDIESSMTSTGTCVYQSVGYDHLAIREMCDPQQIRLMLPPRTRGSEVVR